MVRARAGYRRGESVGLGSPTSTPPACAISAARRATGTASAAALEATTSRPGRNPDGGWPIAKADLDPYARGARKILDLDADRRRGGLGAETGRARQGFRRIHYFRSAPTRFGEKYLEETHRRAGDHPRRSRQPRRPAPQRRADSVTGAVFKGYAPGDAGFTVTARAYALCCGGIENARLLLNFTSQVAAGIGNQNDLVGRYFTTTRAPRRRSAR